MTFNEARGKAGAAIRDFEGDAGLGGGKRMRNPRHRKAGLELIEDGLVRDLAREPHVLRRYAAHRAALVEAIERGPIPAVHGVVRWRIIDLAQLLWDDFSLSVSRPTLSRELRALGYRKLSARPKHHAQDPEAIEAFKRGALPPSWTRSERPSRATHR